MNMSIEDIGTYLIKHNIKPSYPRIRIIEYLLTKKSHPTVDEIFSELAKDIPTLSKTTVYNTLKLFVSSNIACVISIEDNETRFDADISIHGHFKCEKCRAIYDFRINSNDIKTNDLDNFEIFEKNVYYKGYCPKCLENNKN